VNKLIERFIAESTICQGHPQIDGSYFDKEKFAELIVRECISISTKVDKNPYIPDGDQAKKIIRELKQHFGIEK
jgi:hypothetical protein